MSYEQLKSELLSKLFDNMFKYCEVKISPQGAIRVNSEKIDHKNFSDFFLKLCKEPNFTDFYSLLLEAPTSTVLFEDFRRGLKLHQTQMKYSGSKGIDVIKDFSYENFIPFISIENVNKKMFYHKITGEIFDLDYKTYELTVDKDLRRIPIRAVIDFNPYRPEHIYKAVSKYGQECTHINTFKKPQWQYAREISGEERAKICQLPRIIDDFMSHLFPHESCRNFVYDWLHFALTKRCETYLVLNGAKGIGKGIFTDHLCKALIGKENHKLAPPSGLDSNFNAILENCRMIVFDEFRIDEDDKINKLKRYINKDQMIEHKGVDVSKTIETYNSFIISSNSLTDMRISWDDRRFSVMDIAETKLDEVWSRDKIRELIELIEDEDSEEMRQFGYWLLYRETDENEFSVYKGEHFYKLCYSSLPEWSKTIIDEATSNCYEILDDVTLKLSYKERNPMGKFPQSFKVEDFLRNYKHLGKNYLGEFCRDGKNWHIKVDKAFYFKPNDNTSFQWESLL